MAERHPKEHEGETGRSKAEELAWMVDRKITELQAKNPRLNVVLFKNLICDVMGALLVEAESTGDPKAYFKHVTSDFDCFKQKTNSMLLDAMLRRLTKS